MQNVEGKTAFITGGASGIGYGMALVFLQAGMKVIMADNSEANLKDAEKQLEGDNREFMFIRLNVTDRKAMASAAEEAEARFGKIHLLCNNAGIGMAAMMSKATYDDWDFMMSVNLGGVINGVVTFLPYLRKHGEGAHIVNTSSMAGIIPLPDAGGIYTASKFAVRGLSESLRLALAPEKIGVSTLFPGLTRSRILDPAKEALKNTPADEVDPVSASFVHAQENAMDPLDLGRAVLEAVQRNDPFILAHEEFIDEVRSLHDELMAAFRHDMPVHPGRVAMEGDRRKTIEDIKAAMRAW